MGPSQCSGAVADGFALAHYFFLEAAADALGWAHVNVQTWLPMGLLGPIIILGAAANALGPAHCSCCCLFFCLCLLYVPQSLCSTHS